MNLTRRCIPLKGNCVMGLYQVDNENLIERLIYKSSCHCSLTKRNNTTFYKKDIKLIKPKLNKIRRGIR
jgi:hypothetical protein